MLSDRTLSISYSSAVYIGPVPMSSKFFAPKKMLSFVTNGSAQAMEKDLWQHGAAWYDSCGLGSREEKHTQMYAADMQPGTWLGKGLGMVL